MEPEGQNGGGQGLASVDAATLASILDEAPDVAVLHDGLQILYANRRAREEFGASTEARLVGRSLWDFVPPAHHDDLQERTAQLLDGRSVTPVEIPLVLADGREVWGEICSAPIRFRGTPAVQTVVRDVTERKRAEEALAASERRYRSLFDGVPVGLYRSALDGRLLSVNPALVELLGYEDEAQLMATPAPDHYVDPGERAEWVEEALETGVVAGRELRLRHRSGAILTVRLNARLRRSRCGGESWFEGSMEDVTARRAVEEELRRSELRLERAMSGSGLGLWDWDMEAGRVYTDDLWFTMLGYEPGAFELDMDLWRELLHPGDRERAERELRRHLDGETAQYACECRFRTADGGWRWVLDRGQVVERAPDGAPIRAAGTHMDIEDRKRAELARRRSDERLASIFRAAPLGITLSRLIDGVFLEVNDAFARELGYRRHEMLGKSSLDLGIWYDPKDRGKAERILAETGRIQGQEVRFRARDGSVRHVQFYSEVVTVDDEPCALTLHRDVTESLQLEEQLRQSQKMEAVGRLAGGIAHDFNNLLTAMTGHVEFLLDGLEEESALHADARAIAESAERAGRLTRQLLAFSRQQLLDPQVVALDRVIASFEPLLTRLIGEDVTLEVAAAPEPSWVRIDVGQLEQVLLNLVVNARDALPEGGLIRIATDQLRLCEGAVEGLAGPVPGGAYARLQVEDSGTGMDADTLRRAFDPFFTTKPQGKGTGLGLSTVYGIVNQSQGHIAVESERGQGTRFTLYLPALIHEEEAAHEPRPAPSLPEESEGEAEGEARTVLVVEDEGSVRNLVARVLERSGYLIHCAPDGPAALELVGQIPQLDVLVTDVVMPGMNGRELAEELRARWPDLPVVFMSGYTADEVMHDVERRGGQFLAKPFAPASLATAVQEALGS